MPQKGDSCHCFWGPWFLWGQARSVTPSRRGPRALTSWARTGESPDGDHPSQKWRPTSCQHACHPGWDFSSHLASIPSATCPVSAPHSILLTRASSTWGNPPTPTPTPECSRLSSLGRKDFSAHQSLPGRVQNWPGGGHGRGGRGTASLIGRTPGLGKEERAGDRDGQTGLSCSFYVPVTP